jgi:hypothetical protein
MEVSTESLVDRHHPRVPSKKGILYGHNNWELVEKMLIGIRASIRQLVSDRALQPFDFTMIKEINTESKFVIRKNFK